MVLRIPEAGLHLESSEKTADTLPLQAFAFTLSDNVIEDLIQCVQNGEDVKLSLGSVPVSILLCLVPPCLDNERTGSIDAGLLSLRRKMFR